MLRSCSLLENISDGRSCNVLVKSFQSDSNVNREARTSVGIADDCLKSTVLK